MSLIVSAEVILAPQGAWVRLPPSCWSLWPQGGGNSGSSVRHLCPLGRDHADPFHVGPDVPGHMTPALCAIFHVLSKFISVHISNWGCHFFPELPSRTPTVQEWQNAQDPGKSSDQVWNC